MPVYLFTFHAYGTWMPDHPRGCVRRGEGVLSPDHDMAGRYRSRAVEDKVTFAEGAQRALIDEALIAASKQDFRVHHVATEGTHVHVLVSWRFQKPWRKVRSGLKKSLTLRLKQELGRLDPLSENGSRKRVKDQAHFDHLVTAYLPSHSGWKWSETQGYYLEQDE